MLRIRNARLQTLLKIDINQIQNIKKNIFNCQASIKLTAGQANGVLLSLALYVFNVITIHLFIVIAIQYWAWPSMYLMSSSCIVIAIQYCPVLTLHHSCYAPLRRPYENWPKVARQQKLICTITDLFIPALFF